MLSIGRGVGNAFVADLLAATRTRYTKNVMLFTSALVYRVPDIAINKFDALAFATRTSYLTDTTGTE